MPPRTKTSTGFSSLIETDSEPEFDSFNPRKSYMARIATQGAGGPRPRGRPPANANNKVTKPSQKGRRTSAEPPSRQALQEKSGNASRGPASVSKTSKSNSDEVDPLDDDDAMSLQPARRNPKTSNGIGMRNARTRDDLSKSGRGRPPKAGTAQVEETPETQQFEPMEMDEDEVEGDDVEPVMTPNWESGEGTAESDPGDVSLRRRLGELTKKYESLEARHRDLREVGIKDAERNYDRLKKQSDENSAASNKLISELRAELSMQSSVAKKLEVSESKNDSLQTRVAELSNSLSEARSEVKTLSTKLAAARNAEVNLKVPGSALKANTAGNRGPSAEAVQAAQAKEDLYGDLTGLIIRGMKHGDKENVFDCIQTGRNGTLHFKLALDTADARESYEDVQYTYRPQLDPNRDEDLKEVLPDYFFEEITFPRPHASKFFTRVTKSLTERVD